MSPTDAKRGAKRRKNKRGGGSSCSTVCNSSSGKAGVVSALCSQGTTTPVPAVSFLTSDCSGNGNIASMAGLNGEVSVSRYPVCGKARVAVHISATHLNLGLTWQARKEANEPIGS